MNEKIAGFIRLFFCPVKKGGQFDHAERFGGARYGVPAPLAMIRKRELRIWKPIKKAALAAFFI